MLVMRPSPVYPRFSVGSDGSIVGPSGRTLAPMIDRQGYQRVSIYIRTRPTGWGTGRVLAREFGVTESVISSIRLRKVWRHLP